MFIKGILAIIIFLALDAVWLGYIAKKMYIDAFGSILRISNGAISPNWYAALVVYIALISGLLIFVLPKAHGNCYMALLWGMIFGLITYATYDFTNLAVLSTWSLKISIIDSIWGAVLCGITSYLTILLSNWISSL